MVRYKGQIMTDIKYAEVMAQEKAKKPKSLMARLNLYFFDAEKISLHDTLWFYGLLTGLSIVTITLLLYTGYWL